MMSLVIEWLFAVVFLRCLVAYLRRRDPVQRDLTLVFAPFAFLLVQEMVRRALGVAALPMVVSYVGVTLLLAQPFLTLRLVRTLRPVPVGVVRGAFAVFAVTTGLYYLLGHWNVPVVTLVVVVGFFAVQAYAAVLLAGEARRRAGAPRTRLALAAAATAVLGLCLLVSGAGVSAGSRVVQTTAEAMALVSGLGYAAAFMPPRWLRRMWAGNAMYEMHQRMMNAPGTETPGETWHRYAATVRDVSGAAGAVVLLPADTGLTCVAISGDVPEGGPAVTTAELDRLLRTPQPVAVTRRGESPLLAYARRADAQALIVVPLQLPASARGALVLLSRRHPLFVEDDARLLGDLGTQAAILAERGAIAEATRQLNTELERRVLDRTAQLQVAQSRLEDVNHQLEDQNAMLARSNEELQRFAYVASHDLQEPLRKIISFSGLLRERASDRLEADAQMYLDRIVGSAARMQRLIEDLLMFSRAGGRVEVRPVDCNLVLRSVLDALATQITDTQATVTHDPLPTITVNGTHVEQILQNLIGNALKYRSDTPPRIHVGAAEVNGGWRLTVTDNGIGLDMAYAERIFQVFQRLHPRGQYEGTGIGLAVCKRIVESYGGTIGVEAIPGAGSSFWFHLPAPRRTPAPEVPVAVASHQG
jgi:signal transduction histidine kinase